MSEIASKGVPGTSRMSLSVFADAFEGFGELRGMLHYDGRELRLEFQTADALFGVLRSSPKTLVVSMDKVGAVECGLGWFWLMPWIGIELNDFGLLAQVPGMRDGRWRLRVRFKDRQALKRFADALRFARSQAVHAALEAEVASGAPQQLVLPPIPPPLPVSPPRRDSEPPTAA
jgi:hypothetical protein